MMVLVKFLSLACLISFQTINLTSARLTSNKQNSLDSAATSDLVPSGGSTTQLQGDASDDNTFGGSVSLSYNGDKLAVGSPYHEAGLVQIKTRQNSASQWNVTRMVTGDDEGDEFGWSTSLSGDGKRLAIGTKRGYAKLADIKTGKSMTVVGDENDGYFGRSVSVSHDGNRVAIAANGYVRVFQILDDGSLDPIGEDILTDILPIVALSAGGDTLAIGERYHDNWKGRVRIFRWNSSGWKQLGADIAGENDDDYFGFSLDITADGHRVIIGTHGKWLGGNYAKIYDYDGSNWESVVGGKLSGTSNDYDSFGYSVSISANGSQIIIGSPNFTSDGFRRRGRAVVYRYENDAWNQVGHDVLGKKADDWAGVSVAISGNGNIISIGSRILHGKGHIMTKMYH